MAEYSAKQKTLNFIEKYMKTDIRYLLRGGFWVFSGQTASAVAAFFLSVGIANWLTTEQYGNYSYIFSLASILGAFSLTGMSTALVRSVAKGNNGLLKPALGMYVRWSVGAIFLAGAVSTYYFLRDNTLLGYGILIAGIGSPLITAGSLSFSYLEGKKEFSTRAILSTIQTIASVISVLIVISIIPHPLAAVSAFVVSNLLILFGIYLYVNRAESSEALDKTVRKDLFENSMHMSLINISTYAIGQLDRVIIFQTLGATPLAIYAIATAPVKHIQALLKGVVNQLAMPRFAEQKAADLRKSLPSKMRWLFLVTFIVVGSYIVIAPFFFNAFFPKYIESILYSQVFALVLLLFPKKLILVAFTAHAENKKMYLLSLSSAGIRLALLILLLPIFGLWGAIITIMIEHMIVNIGANWLLRHFGDVSKEPKNTM